MYRKQINNSDNQGPRFFLLNCRQLDRAIQQLKTGSHKCNDDGKEYGTTILP